MYAETYFGKEPDPPSPSPSPYPYDSCFAGYTYAGPNVGQYGGITTAQDCANLCGTNLQCGMFSHNAATDGACVID